MPQDPGTTLILACDVMREELLATAHPGGVRFVFLSMGLHVSPDRLRSVLQATLLEHQDVNRVVLGFGLCGGATEGLTSSFAPIAIPRTHDCIPLLQGAPIALGQAPSLERGTFYLSGGWMEGERTLVSEHRRATAKFGLKKAERILATMFAPYHRLLFIRTSHPRSALREGEAQELGEILKLPVSAVEGRTEYLARLVTGPWDPPAFLCFPPGVPVTAAAFASHMTEDPPASNATRAVAGDGSVAGHGEAAEASVE